MAPQSSVCSLHFLCLLSYGKKNVPYFFDISMGKCPLRFGFLEDTAITKPPETEIPGPKLRATDRCTVGGDGSILAEFFLGGTDGSKGWSSNRRKVFELTKKMC